MIRKVNFSHVQIMTLIPPAPATHVVRRFRTVERCLNSLRVDKSGCNFLPGCQQDQRSLENVFLLKSTTYEIFT